MNTHSLNSIFSVQSTTSDYEKESIPIHNNFKNEMVNVNEYQHPLKLALNPKVPKKFSVPSEYRAASTPVDKYINTIQNNGDYPSLSTAQIERLHRVNAAMDAAREIMTIGRGNVRKDVENSQGESRAVTGNYRSLLDKLENDQVINREKYIPMCALLARHCGAGNCAEYSTLGMMMYLLENEDCLEKESVSLMSIAGTDHQWFVVRALDAEDEPIFGDPWAQGPAALQNHFSVKQAKGMSKQKFSQSYAATPETTKLFKQLLKVYSEHDLNAMLLKHKPEILGVEMDDDMYE